MQRKSISEKKQSLRTTTNPHYITFFIEITEAYVMDDNQLFVFFTLEALLQLEMMDRVQFQCGEREEKKRRNGLDLNRD